MTLSQLAADGVRREGDACTFSCAPGQYAGSASQDTPNPARTNRGTDPLSFSETGTAWKKGFFERISAEGPRRTSRFAVLVALARIANRHGQTSLSLSSLAGRSRGDVKTIRRVVHSLNADGRWLRIEPMTWRELVAALPGWRIPEHAEPEGTATYLFTLLDGEGRPAAETFGQAGPKLRGTPKRQGHPGTRRTPPSRARTDTAGHGDGDEPFAAPSPGAPVPAPVAETTDKPSKETEHRSAAETTVHEDEPWKRGWQALVRAHAARSEAVYRVRPLPPKIPTNEQEAMGGCIASASVTLAALVRERTRVVLDPNDALEQLAAQVIVRWFKRPGTNNYLVQTRHRLRSLYEEVDARASEALEDLVAQFVKTNPPPPRRPAPDGETLAAREQHARVLTQFLDASVLPGEHRRVHELPRFLETPNAEQKANEQEAEDLAEQDASSEQHDEAAPDSEEAAELSFHPPDSDGALHAEDADQTPAAPAERTVPKVEHAPDVTRVLDGFANRAELAELADHAKLAIELLTLARERGASAESVLAALDAASLACMRLKRPTAAAKTNAVYRSVLEALEGAGPSELVARESEPRPVTTTVTMSTRPRGLPGAPRWGNTPMRAARVRVMKPSPDDDEQPPPSG